jgi:hypothetical protein
MQAMIAIHMRIGMAASFLHTICAAKQRNSVRQHNHSAEPVHSAEVELNAVLCLRGEYLRLSEPRAA